MEKEKRECLLSLVYDYVESLNIPDASVDIVGEGSNGMGVALTVPKGYENDVDEGEFLHLVAKEHLLDDVDVSLSCYVEGEFEEGIDDIEDPDAGIGDDDPDEEDEVKADRLTVRTNPDEDDEVYLDEDEDGENDEDEEDEDDPELPEGGYEDEEEEYTPTWSDWDDVKDFYGEEDDYR